MLFDYEILRNRVVNWVYSLELAKCKFKMSIDSDSTIYTTCFALFIFDLFNHVNEWSQKEKNYWIKTILSYQDQKTGYFIPDKLIGNLDSKPVQQLTCFCLSALSILGASPRYKLRFLEKWSTPERISSYLDEIGCFEGKSTTGNMSMFLAIYLTYQYEKYHNDNIMKCIDSWFYLHNKMQNQSTGFWGNSLKNRYYAGFQNAFHQFVIYNYWGKPIPNYSKIVDTILTLCDHDGHFGIIPGGGGCYDYDAADILINCGYKTSYQKESVLSSLQKLLEVICSEQNDDGGFCESVKRPSSLIKTLDRSVVKYCFWRWNPYLWYYRLRSTLNASRKKRECIQDHWTVNGRCWNQSDLWNTWFRCLTIAEIDKILSHADNVESRWNFHKCIGLGHFNE